MPLNKQPLAVGASPRSAQEARRWAVGVCLELGRGDLVECAALGASELVTNALLHGQPPITIRVRGTRDHPRVEVHDHSTSPPVHVDAADGAELLTVGRGLGIVARCATAWGARIEDGSKVVWFEPSPVVRNDGVHGRVTLFDGVPAAAAPVAEDTFTVILLGLVPAVFSRSETHYRELRRELHLLSLAHDEDYPLATSLTTAFAAFERSFTPRSRRLLDEARASAVASVDLRVEILASAPPVVARMRELLDLADLFCRDQRLLSLARTPEQVAFQRWFLGELLRQAAGEPPRRCPSDPVE